MALEATAVLEIGTRTVRVIVGELRDDGFVSVIGIGYQIDAVSGAAGTDKDGHHPGIIPFIGLGDHLTGIDGQDQVVITVHSAGGHYDREHFRPVLAGLQAGVILFALPYLEKRTGVGLSWLGGMVKAWS